MAVWKPHLAAHIHLRMRSLFAQVQVIRFRDETHAHWARLTQQQLTQHWIMELRERGNQYFSERKYEQALACYSDAIVSPVDC